VLLRDAPVSSVLKIFALLPPSLTSLTKLFKKFFTFFLHRWEFPVISQMRTNSSGISGI